jgi:signal transduction histidine kinase
VPAMVQWLDVAATLAAHGRQLIGTRPISLTIPEREFCWRSDPAILEQILLNLLRNAVEAIPPATPGEVRVELDSAGPDVVISVLDTGTGLPESALPRMFEPFFTTKAFGTGLGLPITRSLACSLGGEVELRRRDTGGTAAIIRFPEGVERTAGART